MPDEPLHVFLIVGEPSGDVLGGRLMAALKRIAPNSVKFSGVGGPQMTAQGLDSQFDYRELAIMGLVEVVPKLPRLLRRVRAVADAIEAQNPDVIVSIDAPSFVFAVLRRLKAHRQPRIHYVAPQIWAWRPGRVKKFKKYLDHILALFPFEPEHFDAAGMPCTFVSHPVLEGAASAEAGKTFRAEHGIDDEALVVCALPGSRRNEVSKLRSIFTDSIRHLANRHEQLHVVFPTVSTVVGDLDLISVAGVPTTIVSEPTARAAAMAAADIAVAASGTVTLELACAKVPTVVVYKVARLTGWLAPYLLNVKYASIVNILADREVLPEFLQWHCTSEAVNTALDDILENHDRRAEIVAGEQEVVGMLAIEDSTPSELAASAVLKITEEFYER